MLGVYPTKKGESFTAREEVKDWGGEANWGAGVER